MVSNSCIIRIMSTSRLMNVLVALLLVAGQLAGALHLASHVTAESASAQGVAWHSDNNHQVLADAAHLHSHAHQAATTVAWQDVYQKTPQNEETHETGDCVLCHLATQLLAIVTSGPNLPQALATGISLAVTAEPAPAQAFTAANTIRGPPHLSLI